MFRVLPLGPILTNWALQQVGSYPGHTGRDANGGATAAHVQGFG